MTSLLAHSGGMKKSYRRALLFVAVLIFIAVTPVVLLYALGYHTAFTTVDPLPVGVLLIETEPSGGRVVVNGHYVGTTPRSVANLRAGTVAVTIEKDGYATWSKQLRISPGRATEIRDIRLFPTERAPINIAANVRSFSVSPNRRLLAAVQTGGTLTVYDQDGEVIITPQAFTSAIVSVLWSPNSDALLVKTGGPTSFWYLPVAPRVAPAPLTALRQATDPVWDPRIPGRLIYLDEQKLLRAYNVRSRASATLVTNVDQFATSASHLYALHATAKLLTEYTLQGQATGTTISLPAGEVSDLAITPQENMALRLSNGDVWLLNDDSEFQPIATETASLAWSPSGKVLLLPASDSSLYVFNVNDKRTTLPLQELQLVQRLSRPIADPQWFAGGRHLMYQVDDAIWITETDTRDHPVSYEVDTTNTGAAQATVGEEGSVIFYLKKTGSVSALVAAPLLVP